MDEINIDRRNRTCCLCHLVDLMMMTVLNRWKNIRPRWHLLLMLPLVHLARKRGEGRATKDSTKSQQQGETTKKANRKIKGGETEERGKNRELRNKTNNGSRSASQAGVSLYK